MMNGCHFYDNYRQLLNKSFSSRGKANKPIQTPLQGIQTSSSQYIILTKKANQKTKIIESIKLTNKHN